MTLAGYLSEYSLAEIFNFVHKGNCTGLLSISPDRNSVLAPNHPHYLWFESGRIVAVTSGLDGKGLLRTISQRKLMSPAQLQLLELLMTQLPQPLGIYLKSRGLFDIDLLGNAIHEIPQPLGIYLKSYGLLDADQLRLLFNSQTVTTACKIAELHNGKFRFEHNKRPLNAEMTGISLTAQEIGLLGLRVLKDWSGLSAKLPDPAYAIQRQSSQQPNVKLDRKELQLWKLADGKTTLTKLAGKMKLSIESIQQISFRLISFNLIQEIPIEQLELVSADLSVSVRNPTSKNTPVSSSFLGNLKNFLKKGSFKSTK
ncbi:MAG: hypothetical protein RLZZ135_592 [Cyanobacteriota bacterium]|jgi:hypothetical protein